MKRFAVLGAAAICAALTTGAFADTVVEGFEDATNTADWRITSPDPQTLNATNGSSSLTRGTAHVVEGTKSGTFSTAWVLPGSPTTGANPYIAGGTQNYWAIRYNINAPDGLPNNSIPNSAILEATIFNNSSDAIQISLCVIDNNGSGGLERGPFVALAPNASTVYSWNLASVAPVSFVTGNGVLDGASSKLRGIFLYTETAPSATPTVIDVDNIIVRTAQTDFTAPAAPTILKVGKGAAAGQVTINWQPNTEPDLLRYNVYMATDTNFGTPIGNRLAFPSTPVTTVPAGTNTVTLNSVTTETNVYFKLTASDNATPANNESFSKPALGIRLHGDNSASKDLVVLDLDRNPPAAANFATEGYAHMIVYDAQALTSSSRYFESCSQVAVSSGSVTLNPANDRFIVWSNGRDGNSVTGSGSIVPSETLSSQAITALTTYLNAGGKLLISGDSLGEDLSTNGSASDQAFFANQLKAVLANATATTGSIINTDFPFTLSGNFQTATDIFNNAAGATTNNDVLTGTGAGIGALTYAGVATGNAAIYYGNQVVYLGFPFEYVRNEASGVAASKTKRQQLMQDVVNYLFPGAAAQDFQLYE